MNCFSLILKVVIYFEPSLIIILKEFKCMCMSYIIIMTIMNWNILILQWIYKFVHICWCMVYYCFYKTRYDIFEDCGHDWCFRNVSPCLSHLICCSYLVLAEHKFHLKISNSSSLFIIILSLYLKKKKRPHLKDWAGWPF